MKKSTQEMTGRERVMAALHGKECDRLAWSPLIDDYFTASLASQGYQRTDWLNTYRLIGADVIDRHTPTIKAFADDKIFRKITVEDKREVELIETPVGSLIIERNINPWEASQHVTRFPIKNLDDIQTLEYIVEHTHYRED